MLQGLFYCYSLVRIVDEHFLQKINTLIRYFGKQIFEVLASLLTHLLHMVLPLCVLDIIDDLLAGVAQKSSDHR